MSKKVKKVEKYVLREHEKEDIKYQLILEFEELLDNSDYRKLMYESMHDSFDFDVFNDEFDEVVIKEADQLFKAIRDELNKVLKNLKKIKF